jgi:hypothetical protein
VTGQVILLAQSQIKLVREIDREMQLSVFGGTANLHGIDFHSNFPFFLDGQNQDAI